jgi:uncharacterized protein (TIGR02265 family)
MVSLDVRKEALAGGHVKGAMVRAHLQYIRDHLGEEAVERTLAALPESMRTELRNVHAASWCAFETLIMLDRAIARAAGHDERKLFRELGAFSAQINLSTVYRAFRREDIHDFFRRSATLHRQFQDFGSCDYEQVGPTHARLRIRDANCYSAAYCASEAGYLEQVITLHGGTAPQVAESTCRCAGDALCTFEARWR